MSKNTGAKGFRKVDVDQFDEDRFVDQEEDDLGEQGPNEAEVNSLLTKDKYQEALIYVLNNAPVHSRNLAVKNKALGLVVRVLTSYKGDQEACVKSLDQPMLDVLMKYIYRGMEEPSDNSSAALLTWHQKVFAIGGLGSIMRVMTDRKRV